MYKKEEISREKSEIEDSEKQCERVKKDLKDIELENLRKNLEEKIKEFCGESIKLFDN